MDLMELSGRLNRAAEAVRSTYSGRDQKVRDLCAFLGAVSKINGVLEHEIAAACLLHLSGHVSRQLDTEAGERTMLEVANGILRSEA